VATPDRAGLRAVQTPQGFRLSTLLAAHARAAAEGRTDFTDDAAVVEWAGGAVEVVEGDRDNMKITQPEDFVRAEAKLLSDRPDVRVGQGYDVHAFGPGDHVWLGGVRIAHDQGLVGHSDADVGLHALCDAIFGALGDGDIGSHFPPSDMRWKGAASDQFLAFAAERVAERGGLIAHLDLTLVCETPKIGPNREAMRARIAEIARLPLDRVGVKATTSERLGFTGRREGIAALALATLRLPLGGGA
jgi:2-C-methyl-D-erythritol 4-phosphate cytidylyltransferase/2-C-methyl-D-erythritol 2,4-cyclodiphosphate synthase